MRSSRGEWRRRRGGGGRIVLTAKLKYDSEDWRWKKKRLLLIAALKFHLEIKR